MKDFIKSLMATKTPERQEELTGRGKYKDDALEVFGTEDAYMQDLEKNPVKLNPIQKFIQRLLSIRGEK